MSNFFSDMKSSQTSSFQWPKFQLLIICLNKHQLVVIKLRKIVYKKKLNAKKSQKLSAKRKSASNVRLSPKGRKNCFLCQTHFVLVLKFSFCGLFSCKAPSLCPLGSSRRGKTFRSKRLNFSISSFSTYA